MKKKSALEGAQVFNHLHNPAHLCVNASDQPALHEEEGCVRKCRVLNNVILRLISV